MMLQLTNKPINQCYDVLMNAMCIIAIVGQACKGPINKMINRCTVR